jgi:hypothetical protein
MNINDLFENIANIFNQFADEIMAEQAYKNKPITGRGPEGEGKDSEILGAERIKLRWISKKGSEHVEVVDVLRTF